MTAASLWRPCLSLPSSSASVAASSSFSFSISSATSKLSSLRRGSSPNPWYPPRSRRQTMLTLGEAILQCRRQSTRAPAPARRLRGRLSLHRCTPQRPPARSLRTMRRHDQGGGGARAECSSRGRRRLSNATTHGRPRTLLTGSTRRQDSGNLRLLTRMRRSTTCTCSQVGTPMCTSWTRAYPDPRINVLSVCTAPLRVHSILCTTFVGQPLRCPEHSPLLMPAVPGTAR